MKFSLFLVGFTYVACSSSSTEETVATTFQSEATTSLYELVDGDDRVKEITGDPIRIFITDEEQSDTTLLPVGEKFYEQYIKDNSLFENRRNTKDFIEGANVNHYYWGKIKTTSEFKFLLISQREELDFPVNKVFLFVFDKKDKLKSITPVAELGYYPGESDVRYSVMNNNNLLQFITVQEGILEEDGTGDDNPKYLIEKDSSIIEYAFDSGVFNKVRTDTVRSRNWTK